MIFTIGMIYHWNDNYYCMFINDETDCCSNEQYIIIVAMVVITGLSHLFLRLGYGLYIERERQKSIRNSLHGLFGRMIPAHVLM